MISESVTDDEPVAVFMIGEGVTQVFVVDVVLHELTGTRAVVGVSADPR